MRYISKDTQNFLMDLSRNNNREWMHSQNKRYKQMKAEFEAFVNELIEACRDPFNLGSITAKDCIYRINRDVRFSKDKTPYNTHVSCLLSPNGRKSVLAPVYLRIKPDGESLIGGGLWGGPTDLLYLIRQEIDYNADELQRILEEPAFKQRFGALQGDQLKRPPKGYAADHPQLELLKMKQWLAGQTIHKKEFLSKNFMDQVLESFHAVKPFTDFLNVVIREYQEKEES